jgi:hypothetical protein
MAYIHNLLNENYPVSASIELVLPEHEVGDLLFACLAQGSLVNPITTSSSGWQMLGTSADAGNGRMAIGYKVVESSNEPRPVFSGTNVNWATSVLVIKDFDETNIFDVDQIDTFINPINGIIPYPTITTTKADCLVIYAMGSRLGILRTLEPELSTVAMLTNPGCSMHVSWTNQQIAGATGSYNYLRSTTTFGGGIKTIAINNKVGGGYGGVCKNYLTNISNLGDLTHTDNGEFTGPISDIASTIAGLPCSNFFPNTNSSALIPESGQGRSIGFPIGASAQPEMVGAIFTRNTSIDVTGKNLSFMTRNGAIGANRVGQFGAGFLIADENNNWIAYKVAEIAEFPANTTLYFCATMGQGDIVDSFGTIDYTKINKFGWFIERDTVTSQTFGYLIRNLTLHTGATLVSGSPSKPANISDLQSFIFGWANMFGFSSLQGVGQFISKSPLYIGDGVTKSYVSFSTQSLENPVFQKGYLSPARNQKYISSNNAADIFLNASPDDVFDFSSSIFATTFNNKFEILSSSSPLATYDFTGCSISGYQIQNNVSGIVINSAVLVNTNGITLNGGSIEGCTISKGKTSIDLTTNNPQNIKDCNFASSGSGHAIEITSTGSFSFTGNTFSGYGANGTPNASIKNATGGLVTLVLSGTDATPTVLNTAGSSTLFVLPPSQIVVQGLDSGTRIQLYNITRDEEITNAVSTSSTFTFDIDGEAEAGDVIRLRAMKLGKKFIETLTVFSSGASFFFPSHVDDEVYNVNGVDGSLVTGIDIDDDNLLVSISTGALPWSAIYAYESFWLTTAEGIRDEGRFIEAVDPSNYIIYDFKIKNISSPTVPLVITGGWGRDSVTNQTLTLIDTTGGTIFSNPDLVIAFATGSGVTNQDKTDIILGVRNELDTNSTKLDVAVSSRLAAIDYEAPANSDIAAIKTKTDTLVNTDLTGIATTADVSSVPSSVRSELTTELARIDVAISTRNDIAPANATIAAIDSKLDNKPSLTQIESSTVLAKEITLSGKASQVSVDALGTPLQEGDYVAPSNSDIAAIKAKTDTLVNTDLTGIATTADIALSETAIIAQTDIIKVKTDNLPDDTEEELNKIKKNTKLIPAAL